MTPRTGSAIGLLAAWLAVAALAGETERLSHHPKGNAMPRPVKPLRYRPDGADIVIENGPHRFNRPLYGSNAASFVYAGDLPEFLLSLPGKGGTLRLGLVRGTRAKWLAEADRIVARYRAGAMRYGIRDTLLGKGRLTLDVVPMGDTDGAVVRVALSDDAHAADLVWAFGGASGFNRWNLDTCRYCPESACWLKPADCEGNVFTLADTSFVLRAPCHGSRPVFGTVPPGSRLKVANADKLGSPTALLASRGGKRPILAGRCAMRAGEQVLLALERRAQRGGKAMEPADVPAAFEAAEAHRKSIAERVRVRTPDPFLNAAMPALCSAADGLWDPPTYSHGGVAWHQPYLGWRGAYVGTTFGWHDRARTHFRAFAKVQLEGPAASKPSADPKRDLARQARDSVLYTRGYIPVFPRKDARGPYDMQQVYIDQLLWHILWTGDLAFAREMWPVLVEHLAWERRCFDPDGDGLYENFANTLISDAHHYSGGPCAQASAYNCRAFALAARLATLLGKDPKPFADQARKTLAAMNRVLWMADRGWYAEYRDLLGLQRLHPSAELPSIYHPLDSAVPDAFQAWQMLRYVDTQLEHVPVQGGSAILWSSNWVPYIWSVRNILPSEVAHTALAYWQAGHRGKAFHLLRGSVVDAMFRCRAPGSCMGTSEVDAHMTGSATDFCCSVGMFARAFVEGLFGIVPDALAGELLVRPGLPREWDAASIDLPDAGLAYTREGDVDRLVVRASFGRPMRLRLQVAARRVRVAEVTVNGKKASWKPIACVGEPAIEVRAANADGADVRIRWAGAEPAEAECPPVVGMGETVAIRTGAARLCEVRDPQGALKAVSQAARSLRAKAIGRLGHRTVFVRMEQGDVAWWAPAGFEIRQPLEVCGAKVDAKRSTVEFALRNNTGKPVAARASVVCGTTRETLRVEAKARATSAPLHVPAAGLVPGTNPIVLDLGKGRVVVGSVVDWRKRAKAAGLAFESLDLRKAFNDRVTQIFKHEYRSPRSPYCSLQMPLHGFGDWCYGGKSTPTIDDSALRAAAGAQGRFVSPQGIPFATPGPGEQPNVVFTSQWDNFPNSVAIPVTGRARHAYFLVAGSTHPMHSQLDNGELVVAYADGATARLALHNPTTWWPIEADYQVAIDGFCIPRPHPPRIDLGSGRATLLDLPLDPRRELRSVTVRCLANEVVVGLMAVTVVRPQ